MKRDWAPLRYRILGGVEVRDAGRALHVGGPKRRTVLAALLIRANQVVTDEELTDRVWGERLPANARAQLQVHVSELRSLLGKQTIQRRPSGYLITTRLGEVDRERFELLAAQARRERDTGRVDAATSTLREALALWTGSALSGVEPALVDIGRPVLDELRAAAVEELYDAELARGRDLEIIGELRHLLNEFPHRERLWGHLMLALHRAGRTAEALEAYASLRVRFAEELGIEPGKPVQELQQRILRGDTARETQERLDAPAAVTIPAELPHAVSGFVDRQAELDLLDSFSDQASNRTSGQAPHQTGPHPDQGPKIWVLSGPAGIGKTALALHWAHSAVDRFPDGQLYIDLHGFSAHHAPVRPDAALRALLRGLGADARNLPRDTEELARIYRSRLARRRVCVVLDNAATADQVRPLLPGHRESTVLITSRRQLAGLTARHGARLLRLDVLRPDHSVALLAHLVGADAVAAEPEAAAELADICGHLPLALRLAAANTITTRPGPDIGAMVRLLRAGDGLTDLSVGDDETVATAFALSYRSLTAPHARLFRRLGLIPGETFTVHTAAAIDGGSLTETASALRTLLDNHLVEHHRADRYRFHDLIRRYATDRAQAEEDADARTAALLRVTAHFQHSVQNAMRAIEASPDRTPDGTPSASASAADPIEFSEAAAAVAWLRTELSAITAVAVRAAEEGHHAQVWQLADTLRPFLRRGGHTGEWLEIGKAGLAAARERGDERACSSMHLGLGLAHLEDGPLTAAGAHLEQAWKMGAAAGEDAGVVEALTGLAAVRQRQGRLRESIAVAERGLAVNQRLGRSRGQAALHACLGASYGWMGQFDEARAHLERADAYCQETGSDHERGLALLELGWIRRCLGDMDGALRDHHEALHCLRRVDTAAPQALALAGLSQMHCDAERYGQAAAHAESALELTREAPTPWIESAALNALARTRLAMGEEQEAQRLYQRVLRLDEDVAMHWHFVEALIGLAALGVRSGAAAEAVTHGERAYTIAQQHDYLMLRGRAAEQLGDLHARLGHFTAAKRWHETALNAYETCGHAPGADRIHRFRDPTPSRPS